MTELRQKMIRAMELKNFSENTKRSYLRVVSGLAKYYMQPPDTITKEMIEDYLLYLQKEKKKCLNQSKRGCVWAEVFLPQRSL